MRATYKQIMMQLTGPAHIHNRGTKEHLAQQDRVRSGFGAR